MLLTKCYTLEIHDNYIQFHDTDQFRVVTGGTERLEVNNSAVTVAGVLNVRSAIDLADSDILFGSSDDVEFFFDGTNMYTDLNLGDWYVETVQLQDFYLTTMETSMLMQTYLLIQLL